MTAKSVGNIWHPVFRRNKEELSAQIECTDSGGVRRDKELIELILKYLEGPEVGEVSARHELRSGNRDPQRLRQRD